jgi:hypothetical protein
LLRDLGVRLRQHPRVDIEVPITRGHQQRAHPTGRDTSVYKTTIISHKTTFTKKLLSPASTLRNERYALESPRRPAEIRGCSQTTPIEASPHSVHGGSRSR